MAVLVATQAVYLHPSGYHPFLSVTIGSNTMVLIDVRRHMYARTASVTAARQAHNLEDLGVRLPG